MRSLFALVVLAAFLYLGAASWLAVDEVRTVRVEGELAPAEAAQVRQRIGQALDGRLLTVDVAQLREQMMALSWPREVSVRKVWPDTLLVRVAPHRVVARWGEDGFVTRGGKIVASPNAASGLPMLDCAVADPRQALRVYGQLQELASEVGLGIVGLFENEIGEWRVQLVADRGWSAGALAGTVRAHAPATAGDETVPSPGFALMLGADDLNARMKRFLVAWLRFLGGRSADIDRIDLRYTHGMAVRWRAPALEQTQEQTAAVGAAARGMT